MPHLRALMLFRGDVAAIWSFCGESTTIIIMDCNEDISGDNSLNPPCVVEAVRNIQAKMGLELRSSIKLNRAMWNNISDAISDDPTCLNHRRQIASHVVLSEGSCGSLRGLLVLSMRVFP